MSSTDEAEYDYDPKVKAVVYDTDGVRIKWGDEITADEQETVQAAFDDGERDPGALRALIEPY